VKTRGPELEFSFLFFAAQNISVYTISPFNVSDSLDATVASKPCRKEVCGFCTGWRGACSNAHPNSYSEVTKIVTFEEKVATSRKARN